MMLRRYAAGFDVGATRLAISRTLKQQLFVADQLFRFFQRVIDIAIEDVRSAWRSECPAPG